MEQSKPFSNLFYFRRLCKIGGTEQFLYEIAKKYHGYDITVLYDDGDIEQGVRLKKLVRVVRRDPEQIYYAKKAFYNFNIEALENVKADEQIFICHAIYQQLPLVPPLTNPKLTGFIGVSDYACSELKRFGEYQGVDIEPKRIYNPLTLEKPQKVIRIISACRLDDKVKGGARTVKLIEALDRYCEKTGRQYLWHIFTNSTFLPTKSENVILMKPRTNIRSLIADSDYLVQLSNDMESYCYSINEALGYGTRIVRTPLSVAKELPIPKQAEIVAEWDMSNADQVAEQIFADHEDFTYTPPKDGWNEILVKKKSNYDSKNMTFKVQPIMTYFDMELNKQMDKYSEPFECSVDRAKMLISKGFVRLANG